MKKVTNDNDKVTFKGNKTKRIIDIYLLNPRLKRKKIADITGAAEGTVRNVISDFNRNRVTFKGSHKSPIKVHAGWNEWNTEIRRRDFDAVPEGFINNPRNGQKHYATRDFAVTFHQNGFVRVWCYSEGWRKKLKTFLLRFWNIEFVDLFLDSLINKVDQSHVCFESPVDLPNFKVILDGFGTLESCHTPFQEKGMSRTVEAKFTPQFIKDLRSVKKQEAIIARQLTVLSQGQATLNQQNRILTDSVILMVGSIKELIDELRLKRDA